MSSQLLMPKPANDLLSEAELLSESQSLALVEIFVNASLACICYSRELIPYHSRCFQSRFLSDLKTWQTTGNDYLAFHNLDTQLDAGRSQEFKFLVHSENERSNQILDLLEAGIFNSLEKGYLEAVQFFITPDIEDPTAVYESYTFTFSYGKDAHVTGVELASSQQAVVVNAFKSFKKAIKSLLHGLRDLYRLPSMRNQRPYPGCLLESGLIQVRVGNKSLGMSLVYNASCPSDYQPRGFNDGTLSLSEKDAPDWSKLWEHLNTVIGDFDTVYHHVAMGASNAKALLAANAITSSQEEDVDFSNQLQAMQKTSSQPSNVVSTLSQHDRLHAKEKRPSKAGPVVPRASQRTSLHKADKTSNSQEHAKIPNTPIVNRLAPSSAPQTNLDNTSQMSSQPESLSISGRSKKAIPAITASLRNRRQRNIIPAKLAELVVHACALENNTNGEYLFDPAELQKNRIVRVAPSMEVKCECQSVYQTGEMLLCQLCGTMQHKDCYGFIDTRPNRFPQEHFCYACLLLPKEETLNARMPALVRKRLALEYVFSCGASPVSIDASFSKAVHLDTHAPTDQDCLHATVNALAEEGFFAKLDERTVQAIKSKKLDAQIKYLDHLAAIWDQYEAAKDKETTKMRYNIIRSAVEAYTGGRPFLVDEIGAEYDEVTATDAFGQPIRRWGYYERSQLGTGVTSTGDLKRKASSEALTSSKKARGRKLSIGEFISVDRLTPSTEGSLDDGEDALISGSANASEREE